MFATLKAMSSLTNQQPIQRTVGKRLSRDGQALTTQDRAAMTSLAQYYTRAPKGIFRYLSAAQMHDDRQRWTVEAVLARISD